MLSYLYEILLLVLLTNFHTCFCTFVLSYGSITKLTITWSDSRFERLYVNIQTTKSTFIRIVIELARVSDSLHDLCLRLIADNMVRGSSNFVLHRTCHSCVAWYILSLVFSNSAMTSFLNPSISFARFYGVHVIVRFGNLSVIKCYFTLVEFTKDQTEIEIHIITS